MQFLPLFFLEYGCDKNISRTFDEATDAIYISKGLEKLFSGGLYMNILKKQTIMGW